VWTALASFLAFSLLAVLGPGLAAQRLCRVRIEPALVVPVGAALSAGLYWLSLVSGQAWVFAAGILLLDAALLLPGWRWRRAEDSPPLRGILVPGLVLVAVLGATQYRWNRIAPSGEFLLDTMGDHPLHAGITWELTLPYPPQVPGLAGVPLSYHYGADLVRAAALRWANVHPYDAISRFEVTLWPLALALLLQALTRRLDGPPLAVALAPWSLLATDLSFVAGALSGISWWSDVFRGNALISLAFDNPVVAALALAAGALLALSRYGSGEGRGWLFLALIQAAAVPFFKVFLGAQLAAALGLAAALRRGREGMGAAALACAAGLGTLALVLGRTGEQVEIIVAPLRLVQGSLKNLGFEVSSFTLLALACLPWLVVSLGLRVVGLAPALRTLRSGPPALAALAALALSGWPLALLLHASARDVDGRELPTATIYFVEQSGALLWVFAALAIAAAAERWRPRWILVAAALLALPSSIEFVWRKASLPPDPIPAPVMRALQALTVESEAGAVVLQRPGGRYPPLPVILAGRRVPYERFTPYLTQFRRRDDLIDRHERLHRFFQTRDADEAAVIAAGFGASFVCLYGGDRIRFDPSGFLEPIFEELGASVYRIRSPVRMANARRLGP
jgi:hypothetical protein